MQYHLKNLEINTAVGVYDVEKIAPQKLLVNVWFNFDSSAAAKSDDLADTVDYAAVEVLIRATCEKKHYQLLEHLQAALMQAVTKNFSDLKDLKISLEKFPFKGGSVVVK